MSQPPVFLDSGIFIALMSKKDRWHGQAVVLFGAKSASGTIEVVREMP